MKLEDILWIEKHRPRNLEDMILSNDYKQRFQAAINNPKSMPHFLFIGIQGTGKTTLSRILIDSIIKDQTDILSINGSDQRGIEIFRNLIPEFLSVPPIMSPIKIVFIDEGDNMTNDAKKIFRALLEKYHHYARFIVTGNDDTFPPAIKSRFEIFKFTKLDKDYILQFCKRILDLENIQYNEEDIKKIIDNFYPDTRKIVGVLQQNSTTGTLTTKIIHLNNEDKLLQMLCNMILSCVSGDKNSANLNLITISKFITDNYVDFFYVYKNLFNKLNYKCVPLKVVISRYLNKSVSTISPAMIFYEFIYELKNTAEKVRYLTGNEIFE